MIDWRDHPVRGLFWGLVLFAVGFGSVRLIELLF